MSTSIAEVIDLTKERFKSVAPTGINYDAEKGFAMQLLTNSGYLMKVAQGNTASLAQAITNVAAIGLSLNPAEKQAYLIPRTVKEGGNYVSKVFLEPSYMGLCKLATDSGSIEWVQANCVYKNDTFTDNGAGKSPNHSYDAFSKERGEFVGVYCVAKTHSGDYLTTIMDADEVSGIMERSESVKAYRNKKGGGGPWISDFKEQAKKTVVRRAFKMWPRTNLNRMAEAIHLSNENEGFEPILTSPSLTNFTADQKAYYDQLIEQSDALGMYVFLQTIEEGVSNNLYHSFERPKGRYQDIVDSLERSGASLFRDCIHAMNDANGDDLAVLEVSEDLTADALELMKPQLSDEVLAIISEASKEQ